MCFQGRFSGRRLELRWCVLIGASALWVSTAAVECFFRSFLQAGAESTRAVSPRLPHCFADAYDSLAGEILYRMNKTVVREQKKKG